MKRGVSNFLFPGAPVVCLAALFAWLAGKEEWGASFAGFLPHVALAAGLLCGWRFNRGRLVLGSFIAAFAAQGLKLCAAGGQERLLLGAITGVLLPLNIGITALLPEKGVFSPATVLRMIFLLAQIAGAWALCAFAGPVMERCFQGAQFAMPLGGAVCVPALAAFLLGGLFVLAACLWRPGQALETGFVWALIASFAGIASPANEPARLIFLSAAGLALVFAAIEGAYQQAMRDELTGLPARRAFEAALREITEKFTIAMIDIDNFKIFNDKYGHHVGDQVLRMVASVMNQAGGGGRYFRYGGEEFAAIFPGKSLGETVLHLEALRKSVAARGFVIRSPHRPRRKPKHSVRFDGQRRTVEVTISIGAAERLDSRTRAAIVVNAADAALYRAKRAGRNRLAVEE